MHISPSWCPLLQPVVPGRHRSSRGLAGAAPKSPCGRHLPRCLSVLLEFLRAPSALFKGLKMGSGKGGGKGSLRISAWKDDGYFKAGVEGVEKGRAYACAASAVLKRA